MKNAALLAIAALALGMAACAQQKTASQTTAVATTQPSAVATVEASAEASFEASASPEASATAANEVASTPLASCAPHAGQITASYFTLPENHPDVAHDVDDQIVRGLVAKTLGPDGWPVATQAARTGSQVSGRITDVNSAGEILWWTPTSPRGVRLEKVVSDCLPIDRMDMYADGSTDDATYFLTAHYQGFFDTASASTVGLNLGSDDDSWVFIDGNLAVDNGGVKPREDAPYTSAHLSPGRHIIDVFYADRHSSGAALRFDPQFVVSVTPPTPPAGPVATVSPAPTAKAAAVAIAKQLKVQKRIRIYGIHFDVDKATIQPQSETVIAQIAKLMQENPQWHFRVEGHTDSDGGYEHNLILSQNRAQAVVNDLIKRYRIARSRLVAQGYWYSEPVAPNTTAANKALNRRVELVLLNP